MKSEKFSSALHFFAFYLLTFLPFTFLQRVDVVVDLQRGITLVGHHLLLRREQILAHTRHVDAQFEFQHQFADVLSTDLGNGGFIGPQHPSSKPLAQTGSHLCGSSLNDSILTVTQEDVNQTGEWRIVEQLAFGNETFV